jgi:hypothetical protein
MKMKLNLLSLFALLVFMSLSSPMVAQSEKLDVIVRVGTVDTEGSLIANGKGTFVVRATFPAGTFNASEQGHDVVFATAEWVVVTQNQNQLQLLECPGSNLIVNSDGSARLVAVVTGS